MPLHIKNEFRLDRLNTFSLPAVAERFCVVETSEDVREAIDYAASHKLPISVLGGGSNIVLTGDLPGLCLQVGFRQRQIDRDILSLGAGEIWHECVLYSINKGLNGLENLALIPGQVGAAPIQNIGAYGVELAERLLAVDVIDLRTGNATSFGSDECQFGYRDSVFKRHRGEHWLITGVQLQLDREFTPRLEYAGIRSELGKSDVTAKSVFDAVCRLRLSKLPDPNEFGNAGSFFKNPVVSDRQFAELKEGLNGLSGHSQGDGVKLSAAYLIDSLGLKNQSVGGARVSPRHALVIENSGTATGEDVVALANLVQAAVAARFEIDLEIEPRLMP